MKYIIIMVLIICTNYSDAAEIWPGTTAPCNTTLDACVEGTPYGGTIEIQTNGPIDEDVITNNAVSLVAGNGYKPVFASGRIVSIDDFAGSGSTLTISGLTFLAGHISYSASGFDGATKTLNIRNNHIPFSSIQSHAISIRNSTHLALELNVEYNHITYNAPTTPIDRYGAILVSNGSTTGSETTGIVTGRIYNNQITSQGDDSIGVGYYEFSENSSNLAISSNEFRGGNNGAIYISKKQGALADSQIDIAHNAIYNNESDETVNGLKTFVYDGELQINAINNSVIDAHEGFNFQQAYGGIYDINFYNNLIVSTRTSVIIGDPVAAGPNPNLTFTNDYNFFYANSLADPDFVVGPNFITANPKITSFSNARLLPGSPAIEAANQAALLFLSGVPLIDADGLYRIKNGNPGSGGTALDIGAYEAGDNRLLDTLKGTPSYINTIEDNDINEQEFAKLQITQNWHTPNGAGIYNNANIGVYRGTSTWRIFNEDQSTAMSTNTAFNVWNPAPSTHSFVHTATDATASNDATTELDVSGLNNNPDAILSVTQLWDGIYNNNPTGVFYNNSNNKWYIYNSNLADMPLNAQFNVYYQDASANAFVHNAKAANISGNGTYIDHPLLNNTPCAQFQVTHLGISNYPYRTGVYYDPISNRWSIFNQGLEAMPDYARFHVIVSAEQIAECNDIIFADGFE